MDNYNSGRQVISGSTQHKIAQGFGAEREILSWTANVIIAVIWEHLFLEPPVADYNRQRKITDDEKCKHQCNGGHSAKRLGLLYITFNNTQNWSGPLDYLATSSLFLYSNR
jgi:hypothetical protein